MPHPKKRSLHRCKNHPRIIAVGRCTVCKSWICRECSELRKGQFFCRPECGVYRPTPAPAPANEPAPAKAIAPDNTPAAELPVKTVRPQCNRLRFPALLLVSACTLGLCGIVFGLWEMRRNRLLIDENDALKSKRIELINHIKKSNQEISSLHRDIDDLKGRIHDNPMEFPSRSAQSNRHEIPEIINTIQGLPVSFDNGALDKKMIALTFDGSSNSSAVNDILDTLKSRSIKATMFITGDFIRTFPNAVTRIVAEGHEVGNHTFSHPHLTTWAQDHTHTTLPAISEEYLCFQLQRTDSLLYTVAGIHCAPLWRGPYGEKNRSICAWAQHCGYLHVGWRQGKTWRQGLDSNDWVPDEETPGFHTPEQVVEKILALANEPSGGINGGIILMHLGTVRKDARRQMHRMLGKLIDDLRRLGYTFVTVSEMLQASGVDIGLLNKKRTVFSR